MCAASEASADNNESTNGHVCKWSPFGPEISQTAQASAINALSCYAFGMAEAGSDATWKVKSECPDGGGGGGGGGDGSEPLPDPV